MVPAINSNNRTTLEDHSRCLSFQIPREETSTSRDWLLTVWAGRVQICTEIRCLALPITSGITTLTLIGLESKKTDESLCFTELATTLSIQVHPLEIPQVVLPQEGSIEAQLRTIIPTGASRTLKTTLQLPSGQVISDQTFFLKCSNMMRRMQREFKFRLSRPLRLNTELGITE